MSGGAYAVNRGFWDDPDFPNERFTIREAWLWMISEACFGSRRRRGSNGTAVLLERGEFSHSIRFMAKRFQWSKSRVERALTKFRSRDMIRDTSRDSARIYFIKNYDRYQFEPSFERDDDGTPVEVGAGHQRDRSGTNLNKGNNGIKNISCSEAALGRDAEPKKHAHKRDVEPEGFSVFYAAYPRHQAKGDAVRAYQAALKEVAASELLRGARRYAELRKGEDSKFTKLPATWLRKKCWLDADASPTKQSDPDLVRLQEIETAAHTEREACNAL